MKFTKLVNSIRNTHSELYFAAAKAVNQSLTVRNWLIGLSIVEFEQQGEDKAKYGEKLLSDLALSIKIKGLSETNLKLCRQFYIAYPNILAAIKTMFENKGYLISQTVSDQLQNANFENDIHQKSLHHQFNSDRIKPEELLTKLSYSHFLELISISDLSKREFFEIETIKNTWSVRELRRQINTLYFKRSGISKKPDQLSKIINEKAERINPEDIIKSPFTFEFLDISPKDVVYENDLEKALLDHLETFLLEMGHGFCFESKQKRILIGGEYFFIDLVFYHRILKCHVLVELKVDEAKHEHIGQLKTYVNYYKKEIMQKDDNPPVGILLVTNQNKALVEYAIADSDQQLFVSKYLLELPSEKELIAEIQRENNVLREQEEIYKKVAKDNYKR